MLAGMRPALLALVLLAAACRTVAPPLAWESTVRRDHPLVGRIWHVSRGRFVAEPAMLARLARSRYVLLGEKHDNPDHHRLQARVVEALAGAGRRPAVVFEMFTVAQAPALARHLAERPRDAAGIAEAVNWKASGWPSWTMYEPIARAALGAGAPIVAANFDAAEVRALRRDGTAALDPAFAARYALDAPPAAAVERAMADEIRQAHCGHAPDRILPGMIAVQRARDARFADAMLGAAGDGAVLIAGAGHVRNDRGVPDFLRRAAPDARVATVGFVEVEASRTDPPDYGARFGGRLPFDYAWFTPATTDEDPCEKFRRSLERLRR
jgi:uncharacterized iron-regulated protein